MKISKATPPALRTDLRFFLGALLAVAVVVSFVLLLHLN